MDEYKKNAENGNINQLEIRETEKKVWNGFE
jgi:hypothetical protein